MWLAQYLLIKDFIAVLTDHVPPQAWDQNLCLGWGNPQAPGWTKHILCPCADVLLKALAWVSYPVQLRFIRMGPQHKTTGDSVVDHFRISLSSFQMKCLVRGKFCLPWFYLFYFFFCFLQHSSTGVDFICMWKFHTCQILNTSFIFPTLFLTLISLLFYYSSFGASLGSLLSLTDHVCVPVMCCGACCPEQINSWIIQNMIWKIC